MTRLDRRAVGAVAGAAALLAGGGAALASSSGDNQSARCDQRLARIAERRGVSVDQLKADVETRLLGIADGGLCGARHVRPRIALRAMLKAAAGFLGLDGQELREQLPGHSLADLAAKQGKTPAALEAAMLAPAKERLARAVAAGKLPQARADMILVRLELLADRLATKVFPN